MKSTTKKDNLTHATIREAKDAFEKLFAVNKKARTCDKPIMAMLENFDDNQKVVCKPTRNGFPFNRGSLVECLVKMLINDFSIAYEANRKSDLQVVKGDKESRKAFAYFGLNPNLKYEIKYATSNAYASPIANKNNGKFINKFTILVTHKEVKLIETNKLVYDHRGKIPPTQPSGTELKLIAEYLGL